jgi:hypothetical protein
MTSHSSVGKTRRVNAERKRTDTLMKYMTYDPQVSAERYPWKIQDEGSPLINRSNVKATNGTTSRTAAASSPTSVHDFERSWVQFEQEKTGDPFNNLPEDFVPSRVSSRSLRAQSKTKRIPKRIVTVSNKNEMKENMNPEVGDEDIMYSQKLEFRLVETPPSTPPRTMESPSVLSPVTPLKPSKLEEDFAGTDGMTNDISIPTSSSFATPRRPRSPIVEEKHPFTDGNLQVPPQLERKQQTSQEVPVTNSRDINISLKTEMLQTGTEDDTAVEVVTMPATQIELTRYNSTEEPDNIRITDIMDYICSDIADDNSVDISADPSANDILQEAAPQLEKREETSSRLADKQPKGVTTSSLQAESALTRKTDDTTVVPAMTDAQSNQHLESCQSVEKSKSSRITEFMAHFYPTFWEDADIAPVQTPPQLETKQQPSSEAPAKNERDTNSSLKTEIPSTRTEYDTAGKVATLSTTQSPDLKSCKSTEEPDNNRINDILDYICSDIEDDNSVDITAGPSVTENLQEMPPQLERRDRSSSKLTVKQSKGVATSSLQVESALARKIDDTTAVVAETTDAHSSQYLESCQSAEKSKNSRITDMLDYICPTFLEDVDTAPEQRPIDLETKQVISPELPAKNPKGVNVSLQATIPSTGTEADTAGKVATMSATQSPDLKSCKSTEEPDNIGILDYLCSDIADDHSVDFSVLASANENLHVMDYMCYDIADDISFDVSDASSNCDVSDDVSCLISVVTVVRDTAVETKLAEEESLSLESPTKQAKGPAIGLLPVKKGEDGRWILTGSIDTTSIGVPTQTSSVKKGDKEKNTSPMHVPGFKLKMMESAEGPSVEIEVNSNLVESFSPQPSTIIECEGTPSRKIVTTQPVEGPLTRKTQATVPVASASVPAQTPSKNPVKAQVTQRTATSSLGPAAVTDSTTWKTVRPEVQNSQDSVLQIPQTTGTSPKVRLCLLIDGYSGPMYARVLKDLVGDSEVHSVIVRRETSPEKRIRTEVELISLFSVMCSLSFLERVQLQDFTPSDLDWFRAEELLATNPALSSVEVHMVGGSVLELAQSSDGALSAEC